MTAVVKTNHRWTAFALLVVKAFVVLAAPLYFLLRLFFPKPLFTDVGNNTTVLDPTAERLLLAFVLCGPVLLLIAGGQLATGHRKPALGTLIFAIVPSLGLAFFAFVWLVQHLL